VPIIGELRSAAKLEAAQLAGSDAVRWIIGEELIGRLTLHSVRHDGISVVSRDLLDFTGDEFYVAARPELADVAYSEAQRRFESATLVGIVRDAKVHLNPVGSLRLHRDDELVLIAPNERAIGPSTTHAFDAERIDVTDVRREAPGRTLVLGQHSGMRSLVTSLHSYFPPGSTAHVVSSEPFESTDPIEHVTWQHADTTNRAVLDALDLPSFDHVVVVPYKDTLPTHSADARTLVTLLHLRDIRRITAAHFAVVTEMLDDRNGEIADADSADDVIVSDLLVSRLLAQVSRTPRLVDVFDQLFGHVGSETHVRPVAQYLTGSGAVSVSTLIEAASRRGETFIGYRIAARSSQQPDFGVVINPLTSGLVTFAEGDRLIVLADR
jgi:Trk K+ transport system NAD-binding subunit